MATMHSSPESCHDLLHLTGQKYLMLTFEINDFEMAEIKFGSKKCFHLFAKIFFFGEEKKRQHVPKEHFDQTADSGKSCCTEEMSSTSILGLIQAI